MGSPLQVKVFISHRNSKHSNRAAQKIEAALKSAGYAVFFDQSSLQPGFPWDESIIEALRTSEAVILVVDDTTAESDWVQREVDIARALRISILPVILNTSEDDSQQESVYKRLHLGTLQYMSFDVWEGDASAAAVVEKIPPLVNATLKNQMESWNRWYERRGDQGEITTPPHIEHKTVIYQFIHPHIEGITFNIATGDATELDGYEVLVNSENTYMQMARFFERHTLSRQIRVNGAYRKSRKILEDTIQNELEAQIANSTEFGRTPLTRKDVVVTGAGHKESQLVKLGFRYILHVAAVDLSEDKLAIDPLPTNANIDIVQQCLKRLIEIEEHQGRILYDANGERCTPYTESVPYRSIQSILFPVFGAGQGGNKFEDAVEHILLGFRQHANFLRGKGMPATTIGLCIYDFRDVETVVELFNKHGFQMLETASGN